MPITTVGRDVFELLVGVVPPVRWPDVRSLSRWYCFGALAGRDGFERDTGLERVGASTVLCKSVSIPLNPDGKYEKHFLC